MVDKTFMLIASGLFVTLAVASLIVESYTDKKFLSKELNIEYESLNRSWFSRSYASNGNIWEVTGTIERAATCISKYNN
jgi:hypothetical protein